MQEDTKSSSFIINSAHESFAEKQKSLFAHLDDAERSNKRSYRPDSNMETDESVNRSRQRSITKSFKRKESIFKRPEAPISKCLPVGRIPNFRLNPNKWTKYSLADVKDEDISDRGNTSAALSFLRELEERKGNTDEENGEAAPEKITFKKTALVKKARTEEPDEEKNISFRCSKVVMPEYVVGQTKKKKERKNMLTKMASSTKQLKLDHLLDEEEDT